MFEDDNFEQNINNNEIPMKEVVEWLINEQNKRTNSSGLSVVNKDFIVDLFFTGGQDFKKKIDLEFIQQNKQVLFQEHPPWVLEQEQKVEKA